MTPKKSAKAQRRRSDSKSEEQKLALPPREPEQEISTLLDGLTQLRRDIKGHLTGAAVPDGFPENGLSPRVDDLCSLLGLAVACLDELRRVESAERIQRSHVRLLALCALSANGLPEFGAGWDPWQAATDAVRHTMLACVDVADAELREAKLDLMRVREHLNNLAMKNHKRTH